MQGAFGCIIGIGLAFYFSWRMALVTLAIAPFMMLGGILKSRFMKKEWESKNDKADSLYKESNALLSDIIMNYRTVIGFGPKNVEFLVSKYSKMLEIPNLKGVKSAHIAGICFGYTNCIRYTF